MVRGERTIDFYSLLSFTEGDAMTTEMQEIAITEDKPLLTGQADAKVRHTHPCNICRMDVVRVSTEEHINDLVISV